MTDHTDGALLQTYAETHSEPAFNALVNRHVDLVYSAAKRMVRDPHLAEDVTQQTFVALAKNAPQLVKRTVLSGWLHRTAQNIAAQTVRTIERRRVREEKALAMNESLPAESDILWEQLAPYLDAALSELSEPDRNALLLRYFERKSAHEMAAVLGVSNETAQKRVSRAVERLRRLFAERGITVGASGLVLLISANAVEAAPIGLAITISAAAALVPATFIAATTTTVTKTIVMTALQKTLVTATIVVLAGATIYEMRNIAQYRKQVDSLRRERQQLIADRDAALFNAALSAEQSANRQKERSELLGLRTEVSKLRNRTNELGTFIQNHVHDPQTARSTGTSAGSVADQLAADYVARDAYAFAGYADPDSAIKSLHWAMSQADVKAVLASATPEVAQQLKAQWGDRTDAEIAAGLANDNDNKLVIGYRVTGKQVISEDEVVVTIFQDGRNKEKKMRLQRVGGEWKYAGPPRP